MMKKRFIMILIILFAFLSTFQVQAADFYPIPDTEQSFSWEDTLQNLWFDQLESSVPDKANEIIEDSSENIFSLLTSPSKIWKLLQRELIQEIRKPMRIIGKLMGCILICALLSAVKESNINHELQNIFLVISAVYIVSLLQDPIFDCITQTMQTLQETSLFIMSFVPVMSGIMAAGGYPTSAGAYSVFLLFIAELLTEFASRTLVPLLSIYLALCIVAPMAPCLPLNRITGVIKSVVCWGLSIITTIFVGMLSLQTAIAHGGDSMFLKTSKFLVGNFIPVIGSTVSDALETAKGCILIVKNVVGSLGIVVAAVTLLPQLITVCLWYWAIKLSAWMSEMLYAKEISQVLSSIAQTFSMLIALVCCFMLLFLVSTALMLRITIG